MPKIILLQETPSTNDFLKRMVSTLESGTLISAYQQSAGRGQKGNTWEAEPGKNVTMSLLIKKPRVGVKEQFAISEAVSLAIVEALEKYVKGIKIKWPNDIYYNDGKIGGILIEHSLAEDAIDYTIAGVGVNINQQVFTSGVPNPMSLKIITGEDYDMNIINEEFGEKLAQCCDLDGSPERLKTMHQRYLNRLYRYDGKPYQFVTPQGKQFEAVIYNVSPDGTLFLRHTADNSLRQYQFKEVGFVINRVKYL
ncbi:MAG: biotin--[acetyl-CoA-carboxylase] ligase [Muribaculaceae bacterium]|nr:biotin--[acetyl-CoA-carboxylase] ligase [Muribaculaceae bacterium]